MVVRGTSYRINPTKKHVWNRAAAKPHILLVMKNKLAIQQLLVSMLAMVFTMATTAQEWTQFRGPNGTGISNSTNLPVEFGPDKNCLWKTPLPAGHSSPVIGRERIFLTGFEGEKLFTIGLDRKTGKLLWKQEVPRGRNDHLQKPNNPASPSPVTDGQDVVVFFQDFGLLAFDQDGRERWRLPLGPFNSFYGMAASPILVRDTIILPCDQDRNSFMIAVDHDTGRIRWDVYRAQMSAENGLVSIKLGGRGDMTSQSIRWKYTRTVPQVPSALLYQGVLYMVNDGGLLLSFKPETGDVIKHDRLEGAIDKYFASPVAAAGKVYLVSETGKVSVVEAAGEWSVLKVNKLEDQCYATPAIVDQKIYIRTQSTLYCFGTGK